MIYTPINLDFYQECNLEEVSEEEEAPPTKSSKDKKANGPDAAKTPGLSFKLTSRVQYKTVLKGTCSIFSLLRDFCVHLELQRKTN